MKKNDFATFVAYLGMFGIAIGVGLGVIRGKISGASLPVNGILLIVISALVGILLNSVLMELGHIVGAKIGKYKITLVAVLGLNFGKKDGKKKAYFKTFDGLTGQTKIVPLDPEKSSPSAYIFFPVLFLLVEVVVLAILLVFTKQNASYKWLEISIDTVLCIGAMIYFYNLFPAKLDSTTDGYLMMLVGKQTNRVAYNHMLLADDAIAQGKEPGNFPIYDEITDFTARLNNLSVWRLILEEKPTEAISILNKTIETEKGITDSTKNEAYALKLCLLLLKESPNEAKEAYDSIEDGQRKFIAEMLSYPALLDYMLVSARLDESFVETKYAFDKKEHIMKHVPAEEKPLCEYLDAKAAEVVKAIHPTWDLSKEAEEE